MNRVLPYNSNTIMKKVAISCIPMLFVTFYISFHWFFMILICGLSAQVIDLLVVHWRYKHRLHLGSVKDLDYSALVTGILLGLCLPPGAPVWLVVTGSFLSIIIGKHIYGGIGSNPFNPAMVAYLMLLLGFPMEMTQWSEFTQDSITQATLLDRANQLPIGEWAQTKQFHSKMWIAAAACMGGLWLYTLKIIRLTIPLAVITSFYCTDVALYDQQFLLSLQLSAQDLVLTAVIFGAFFIATDPVTAPSQSKFHIIYGAGIGILSAIIHQGERYPDGFAFAVLFMNILAPTLDALAIRKSA